MTSHTASCGPLLGVLALPLQHQGAYIVPGLLIVLVVAAITQGELEKGKNKGGNSGTTKSSFLLIEREKLISSFKGVIEANSFLTTMNIGL